MSRCSSCGRAPEQHRHSRKVASLPTLMRDGRGGFVEKPWERIRCRPPQIVNYGEPGVSTGKTNVGDPVAAGAKGGGAARRVGRKGA